MSVVSVEARSFILALFIRDDGERFLLGDNGYDFIDSQLHFTANAIENDEVQKQGTDGVLVAGQVRRASVQTFDGYIGDATTPKSKIEQMRRDFFAFFAKGHHFRVIYVDCNRSAWQRKGGYLVDAPEVKELWQIHPEYHVGLNFEDVNYYEYDENAEGEEILANVLSVPISSEIEGGLEWDEDGAISVLPYGDSETATGNPITIADAVEAPLKSLEIQGNTTQQTYTGKNLLKMPIVSGSSNGITWTVQDDGSIILNGTSTAGVSIRANNVTIPAVEGETYTLSATGMGGAYNFGYKNSGSGENIFVVTSASPTTTAVVTSTMLSQANRLDMYIQSGKTFNNQRATLQLEKGSSASSFEPYVGGVPSPNPDYPQAVQTVTGENVVQICGKNLWGAEEHGSINENTGKDVWSANRWRTVGYVPVESNTAYTLSSNASADIWYIFCFYDSGKNFISGAAVYGSSQTQTTPANCEFMRCVICDTASIKTTERQLEKGSSASSFEPYQGQSYEVNLGKNLFNKDSGQVVNAYFDNSKISTGNSFRTAYISCEPNTTYTVSKMQSSRFAVATTTDLPANNVATSGFTQNNTATSITITTGAAAKYIVVFLYHAVYDTTLTPEQILATLQIEKGSQATSYAAYFTPIELCKIGTYQDSIYKSGGKWYVRKEVGHTLYTGNVLGIAANQSSGENTVSATGAFFVWVGGISLMSENLGTLNGGAISGNADANAMTSGTFATRSGTPDRLYFRNTAYIGKTGNEMKAILAANSGGASVWYALATPTDTEITNEALVAQLDAILSQGYTYAGTNNITTITPNEQGELEVGYYTGYQDGGYVWEEGGSGGPTTVVNESISAVYPVWTVYGPAQNPILENTTNNTSIEYVGMVADGQTLVIDMGAQTASLDGLNVLSALTGDFIQLEAGTNILLYSASNDAPASEIGWSEIVG